jgi:hypothetical protein
VSDKVRPALTPEEWSGRGFNRPGVEFTAHERDGTPFRGVAYGMSASGGAESMEVSDTVWHGDARHALAALALHGQPFGFTWDDVDRLRRRAADAEAAHDNPESPMRGEWAVYEEMLAFAGLADRIAALLPPQDAP